MAVFTREEACDYLDNLVGEPLSDAWKLPDTELYHFGFGDYIEKDTPRGRLKSCIFTVHAICDMVFLWKNGSKKEYDADTPPEEFCADIQPLIGLPVRRAILDEENDLWLDFGVCYIAIVPYEDGGESWRFFYSRDTNKPHLVVSNSELSRG